MGGCGGKTGWGSRVSNGSWKNLDVDEFLVAAAAPVGPPAPHMLEYRVNQILPESETDHEISSNPTSGRTKTPGEKTHSREDRNWVRVGELTGSKVSPRASRVASSSMETCVFARAAEEGGMWGGVRAWKVGNLG